MHHKDHPRPGQDIVAPGADPRRDRTVRASNQDREAVVNSLSAHTSAGRLTLAEFEERTSAAYAAQTLADLDTLQQDLPAVRPEPARAPAPRQSYRSAWSPWLLAGGVCTLIWLLSSLSGGFHYFWPIWVIGPWGLVMLTRVGFPRPDHRRRVRDRDRYRR